MKKVDYKSASFEKPKRTHAKTQRFQDAKMESFKRSNKKDMSFP